MISDADREFLRSIQAAPSDSTAKLVYADWLEERGDVRSQFLRLFVRLLEDPDNLKYRETVGQLRIGIDPVWLSAVGDTPERLRNIAKVLDARAGGRYFEYVQALASDESYRDLMELHLRCTNSCIGIHHQDLLLDLEVSVEATDPHMKGGLENALMTSVERIRDVRSFIASPEVAPAIGSLYLWQTSAANGTAEIILDEYVPGNGQFSNLKRFATNYSNEDGECIIGSEADTYAESGLLAKLLQKCPVIEELMIPSAPNHEFFGVGTRPLRTLRVKAGFDTQNFILNLGRSSCFPQLESLSYRDYNANPDDLYARATPFEHYAGLLRSPVGRSLRTIELTDVVLSRAEIQQLLSLRRDGLTIRQNGLLARQGR